MKSTRRELMRWIAGAGSVVGAVALLPGALGLELIGYAGRAVDRVRRVVVADVRGRIPGAPGMPPAPKTLRPEDLHGPHDLAG